MAKVAAITLALLASASSLAWAQGAAMGVGGPPAAGLAPQGMTTPGTTAPAGFTIDQKGVKRMGSSAPAPGNSGAPGTASAAERRAGPLPGNGKDANTDNRAAASGFGAYAPLPAKGQVAGTGKTAVGAGANPTPDGSGNKSFFESRSNTNPRTTSPIVNNARTLGAVATPGPTVTDGSGNKSFFESRSNTARTDGAAAKATSEPAPSAGSIFKN